MKPFPAIALAVILPALAVFAAEPAKDEASWEILSLNQVIPGHPAGSVDIDVTSGRGRGTNGIFVRYITAERTVTVAAEMGDVDTRAGIVTADGNVRIESDGQVWMGEHIEYNFKTRQMRTEQFRTGRLPVLAGGTGLSGDASNHVYTATSAFVTPDDYEEPAYFVRASRVRLIPGKTIQMWNAVMYVKDVPVFYFPYYERPLGPRANHFTTRPGYRSRYGGFVLNTYSWFAGDVADGKIHLDYRTRRGVGVGPDLFFHLGKWGELEAKYYFVRDGLPNEGTNAFPQFGAMRDNRQRAYLGWQATPATNLNLKALINHQSDPLFRRDYFDSEYTQNPQPGTFFEANKHWDNWSLDALATPRLNNFFSQIERLPDVRLTGFRQQVLDSPVYYNSESSLGWYRAWAANLTNGLYPGTNGFVADSAARADTYHQLTLPWTFFNWLNVAPHAGGRFTYYSQHANSAEDVYRGVFNTGVSSSIKASRLWADATNSFLRIDGLRHIIEPSADYVFVPRPGTTPALLPQFDAELPALMLLPLMFPEYNSIDSIDARNVVRFGLRNTLQTLRRGAVDTLLNWKLLLDWRLDPQPGQDTLNDLYSHVTFKPRSWLTVDSQLRYDVNNGDLNMAFHQFTFAPGNRWSWGIGHWYLRPGLWGNGNWLKSDYISSTLYYRFDDNWGLRAMHNYDAESGRLQQQFYTVYRDMRSWTLGLTVRVINDQFRKQDFTIAFAFSLKASPTEQLGYDTVNPHRFLEE